MAHLLPPSLPAACGLYYAAELAEEYSSIAKRIITWTTVGVIVIHFSLLLEGFPPIYICTGVACHLAYALLLTNFPFIEVVSVKSLIVLGEWLCTSSSSSVAGVCPFSDSVCLTCLCVYVCVWQRPWFSTTTYGSCSSGPTRWMCSRLWYVGG